MPIVNEASTKPSTATVQGRVFRARAAAATLFDEPNS